MTKLAKLQGLVSLVVLALPLAAGAQVPVDDDGNVIGSYEPQAGSPPIGRDVGEENIPLLTAAELEELVGPIALYPDDLLAVVLPASAYPLQIIEAARFLEALESDPSLEPDPEWDDSVVALLNYPEVVALMNDEIDWTWQLGEAVVAQQADVVAAIESFRDRAYAAGNLRTDEYQTVSRDDGVIEITPVSEEVIYVPYYEPERVVVYQPRPVYFYYPRAYPVYYYPYSSAYIFDRGFFWGVTTAFTVGWLTDSLHVYHHSYYGHPYYGHSYWDRWWYRRPSINVYNTTYVRSANVTINRYYRGDHWQPRHDRRRPVRPTQPRVMNKHYYGAERGSEVRHTRRVDSRAPIRFRDRGADRDRSIDTGSRRSDRDRVARQVTASREKIARLDRNRGEPVTQRRLRSDDRGVTQRNLRQGSRPVTQPQVRRETRATVQSQARRESRATPQREIRRESRPVAEREIRRESRPVAQREIRRQSRPTAQPQVRRETRAPVQSQSRREARPTPQREVRRESRAAPEREVRRESRPAPREAESPAAKPTRSGKREKNRRNAR